MPPNHLVLCCPLLFLPSLFLSIRVFSNESPFASGSQSIGASASTSVPPMNIQDWSPLGWTRWISLQSKGLSRVFSNTTVQKHQFFSAQSSLWSNLHICTWLLEKPYLWLYGPLSAKSCLCFLTPCVGLLWFFFQGASGYSLYQNIFQWLLRAMDFAGHRQYQSFELLGSMLTNI